MNWYFEEWYKEQDMLSLITDRDGAEAAWFYQQERIEELEREFEQQLGELEDELNCVRAYNDELWAEIKRLRQSSNGQAK